MYKNNKWCITTMILVSIYIFIGLGIIIHGVFFNEDNYKSIEIISGVFYSLILLIPSILYYLGYNNNKKILLLVSSALYLIITSIVYVMIMDIEIYNIISIITGIVLVIISFISYIKYR